MVTSALATIFRTLVILNACIVVVPAVAVVFHITFVVVTRIVVTAMSNRTTVRAVSPH